MVPPGPLALNAPVRERAAGPVLPLPQGVSPGTRRKRDREFGLRASAAAGDLFLPPPPSQPRLPRPCRAFPWTGEISISLGAESACVWKKVNFIRLR